jgi:hypothetical protein
MQCAESANADQRFHVSEPPIHACATLKLNIAASESSFRLLMPGASKPLHVHSARRRR